MSVSSDTIRRLAALNLAPEAMSEVLSIIADLAGKDDERRAKDRARKRRSAENPQNIHGSSAETDAEQATEPPAPPSPPHTPPITPTTPHDSEGGARDRSASLGKPIPAGWQPRPEERDLALGWGWSPAEFDDQLERFRDYWLARSGRERLKRDWDRTFRNRLKELNDRRNRTYQPTGKPAGNRDKHSVSAGFDFLDEQIAGRGHGR